MTNINQVNLTGNLIKDAELKYTKNGTAILNFSIAVNDYDFASKGTVASFFNCVIWGKLAEGISGLLIKGIPLAIAGKLKQENYEDKQGQKRSVVKIIVRDIQIFSKSNQAIQKNKPLPIFQEPINSAENYSDQIPF